ncbi:hypothetical protein AMEX_G26194 [Astyanax mexicanus]|uniref:Spermatogenesis-associated protein 2 PUB-like domain-containing protein n=1 Tax=Astyanax mexicanus TaxID=7994 RepID=A0A8T2KW16_ASTMX|nr:hypothetical protein AMEX_G26194 [Astyanax mexicanus]
MTSSAEEDPHPPASPALPASPASPASREDILHTYVTHYRSEWTEGRCGQVCADRQVRARAREVLLREAAEGRFSLLPFFYPAVTQCLQRGAPLTSTCLSQFMKATELLEMMCVNLFLFPWKKEIRTLKKFTGHFVYYIDPGLPNPMTRNILQSIGYTLETDTEYILVDDVDPDVAKRMGFELFLARLECEYLLEAMQQKSHSECMEIIHNRATCPNVLAGSVISPEEEDSQSRSVDHHDTRQEVLEDIEPLSSGPKSNPTTTEEQECLQSLKPSSTLEMVQEAQEVQENTVPEEGRSSQSFMSEDRSILEMQENYPDLAFRQKPIFRKSQKSTQPPKVNEWTRCAEPAPVLLHPTNTDLSGPQSIAMHVEPAATHRKLQIPEKLESTEPQTAEEKPPLVLRVGSMLQNPGFSPDSSPDDGLVTELAERMCKLQMKDFSADEPLKYPIEETAQAEQCVGCQEFIPISPLRSPEESNPPVVCRPTQQPMCTIAGCGRCSGPSSDLDQNDSIKEPPHSFYIPNCLSAASSALAPPTGHDQNCGETSSLRIHRSPTQQPEDDLLQTYVML